MTGLEKFVAALPQFEADHGHDWPDTLSELMKLANTLLAAERAAQEKPVDDRGMREALEEIKVEKKEDGYWLSVKYGAVRLNDRMTTLIKAFMLWQEKRDKALSHPEHAKPQEHVAGLREKLMLELDKRIKEPNINKDFTAGMISMLGTVMRVISRHPADARPTESLAELADKAGWIGTMKVSERPSGWRIIFSNGNVFIGKTYQEAESKARAYLEGLKDTPAKEK